RRLLAEHGFDAGDDAWKRLLEAGPAMAAKVGNDGAQSQRLRHPSGGPKGLDRASPDSVVRRSQVDQVDRVADGGGQVVLPAAPTERLDFRRLVPGRAPHLRAADEDLETIAADLDGAIHRVEDLATAG